MNNLQLYIFLLLSFLLLGACESNTEKPEFDRTAFLENYAKNIIQPTSADLLNKVERLQATVTALVAEQNEENLEAAQAAWDATYRVWQRTNSFNFGPGSNEGLRRTLLEEVGTFPADVEDIEEKIASGNPDFADSKRDTRGLLAIEYLLFGTTDNAAVLAGFDERRLAYLQEAANKLLNQIQAFDAAWQGEYAAEFIASNGTDVKSSTPQMLSEFIRCFEAVKDKKIANPFGLVAGQKSARPQDVEARFSKKSLEYLILNYQSIVDLWYGKGVDGTDGIGWQEYLLSVEGGEDLVNSTIAQFEKIQATIDQIPPNKDLQTLAVEGNQAVIDFQNELQNSSHFLKSDISSLLSLAVTFSIIDGD
ncbi:MAG: imelysin family protein [Bacteroidota bacterium]